MTEESTENQVSIFDQDLWFSKMSAECFPLETQSEKTSESFSKRRRELPIVTPQFLDCRTDRLGLIAEPLWETTGLSLGGYTPRSFGVAPNVVIESRLSQILEVSAPPPILFERESVSRDLESLEQERQGTSPDSERGIGESSFTFKFRGGSETDSKGRKAGKGALIQDELSGTIGAVQDQTLVTSKCYGISPYESNAMNSGNPNSGIYEAESARTLDENGGNPACNQGGIAIVEPATCYSQFKYDKYLETETSASIKQAGGNIGGERDDSETIGPLCSRDYKGVGDQYVREGKVIVQRNK